MKSNLWEKHRIVLKNKDDIINKYKENIPIKKIAEIYNVSKGCMSTNLRLWNVIKRHGIKYLLSKFLKEE